MYKTVPLPTYEATTKRVRFSDASNRMYLPQPTAQSPCWSTPSLTFSSVSSSPNDSVVPSSPQPIQLNHVLAKATSTTCAITFDVSRPPLDSLASNSLISANTTTIQDLLLSEPVSFPPTQSLILVTDLLPWYIKIEAPPSSLAPNNRKSQEPFFNHLMFSHATADGSTAPTTTSAMTPREFITVADLLAGIFNALQRPVTPAEYSSLSAHAQIQTAGQFYRRLDKIRNVREMNKVKRQGVKRVDLLLGNTIFSGLGVLKDGACPLLSLYLKAP